MTNIEIDARELIKNLLSDSLPGSHITLTLLGEFPFDYPYANVKSGREIGIKSIDSLKILSKNKILTLHRVIPSSNGYPVKPTKFIVSYKQNVAEEFLDTVSAGNFSLRINSGDARFKNNKTKYKPGSQPYNWGVPRIVRTYSTIH